VLLITAGEPLFPGVLVLCRTIGMFQMSDEKGGDDKLICVSAHDSGLEHLRDIHHLPKFHRREIQHFFEIYKELEPGKGVEGASWVGRAAAEAEIDAARQRAPPRRTGALSPSGPCAIKECKPTPAATDAGRRRMERRKGLNAPVFMAASLSTSRRVLLSSASVSRVCSHTEPFRVTGADSM
jgi:hypothetical protein